MASAALRVDRALNRLAQAKCGRSIAAQRAATGDGYYVEDAPGGPASMALPPARRAVLAIGDLPLTVELYAPLNAVVDVIRRLHGPLGGNMAYSALFQMTVNAKARYVDVAFTSTVWSALAQDVKDKKISLNGFEAKVPGRRTQFLPGSNTKDAEIHDCGELCADVVIPDTDKQRWATTLNVSFLDAAAMRPGNSLHVCRASIPVIFGGDNVSPSGVEPAVMEGLHEIIREAANEQLVELGLEPLPAHGSDRSAVFYSDRVSHVFLRYFGGSVRDPGNESLELYVFMNAYLADQLPAGLTYQTTAVQPAAASFDNARVRSMLYTLLQWLDAYDELLGEMQAVPAIQAAAASVLAQMALRGVTVAWELMGIAIKESGKVLVTRSSVPLVELKREVSARIAGMGMTEAAQEVLVETVTMMSNSATEESHDSLSLTASQLGAREFAKANTHLSAVTSSRSGNIEAALASAAQPVSIKVPTLSFGGRLAAAGAHEAIAIAMDTLLTMEATSDNATVASAFFSLAHDVIKAAPDCTTLSETASADLMCFTVLWPMMPSGVKVRRGAMSVLRDTAGVSGSAWLALLDEGIRRFSSLGLASALFAPGEVADVRLTMKAYKFSRSTFHPGSSWM